MSVISASELHGIDLPWSEVHRAWVVQEVNGLRIMVFPMIFTAAIGTRLEDDDHDLTYWMLDRWCYDTPRAAVRAAEAWDGAEGTEPQGWHRHPSTGRRRPGGDAAQEHVMH